MRQYDAWGRLELGTSEPGYSFTGRDWDPEIGLYYYRARHYDPFVGRFLSADPLPLVLGHSLYVYVEDSPANLTDPRGLQATATGLPPTKLAREANAWGRSCPVNQGRSCSMGIHAPRGARQSPTRGSGPSADELA